MRRGAILGVMSTRSDKLSPSPVSPETLAKRIHKHPESIRRAIRGGRIVAKKFGRDWGIPFTEAERIISNGLPRFSDEKKEAV